MSHHDQDCAVESLRPPDGRDMALAAEAARLKSRRLDRLNEVLLVNAAGRFALAPNDYHLNDSQEISSQGKGLLRSSNLLVDPASPLSVLAHRYGIEERQHHGELLDYLILVPTLRCNLSCSYCQVSRVNADQPNYDWDEHTLNAVFALLDSLPTRNIKIEFQGGEATLRPDLIEAVIERCSRFDRSEFVICTNLQRLDERLLALFERADVYISTSLDGDIATHERHRTLDEGKTRRFFENLRSVLARFGSEKVSALPTIDPRCPPDPDELIDVYGTLGLTNIFLRPINYQGFARKRHGDSREQGDDWRTYYRHFVERLIARNWQDRTLLFEETYLGLCLRRIFRPQSERHVDLRSPNPVGVDYVVIDYDGTVYPTDEARMLARSGVIDLAIGDVRSGWDSEARAVLNAHSTNVGDPACDTCAYQPFCGRDLIDDLSRYGTIDLPRHETEYCRKHLALFDLAFELLYSDDPATRYSVRHWLRLPGETAEFGVRLS